MPARIRYSNGISAIAALPSSRLPRYRPEEIPAPENVEEKA